MLLAGTNPLGLPGAVGPAIYIAVTVFLLVIVARFEWLSVVPANVYGYAETAAYGLQTANAASTTAVSLANPVVIIIISTVLGAIFGLVSAKVAAAIEKP